MARNTSTPQYRFETPTTPEYLLDLIQRIREALPISEETLTYNATTMDILGWSEWRKEHPEALAAFTLLESAEIIAEYRCMLIDGRE